MANTTSIPTGLNVPSQIPLDTVKYVLNESTLSNLGTNNNLAFRYFKNLVVHCFEESSNFIWREVEIGEENTGLLNVDYTYPLNHTANGIDYSEKVYNFFPYTTNYDVANIGTGVDVYKNSTDLSGIRTFNFRTLTSSDDSLTIIENANEIDLTVNFENNENFANADLTFTGNRIHNLNSNKVVYDNAKQIKTVVDVIQPTGEASYEEKGFGTTITDIIKRIFNGAGAKIVEIFGNKAVKFYGNIWSNGLSNNSSNTVFGEDAFISNSVGLRNSTFGFNSLKNATGNDNTAFGMQSLMNLTTGIQNTAVGMEAGFSIVDGVQNTVIGYGATSKSGADSSFNTVVGFASLNRTEDEVFITESHRCTILGNDVKVNSGNLTPNNQIIIGDTAIGEGDNTAVIGSLDIEVLYIPRHTTTEINTFTGMSTGAMVFNTTLNTLCFYNGASWRKVTDSAM